MFRNAFAHAVRTTEERLSSEKKGSRIVTVKTQEEFERQAVTLAGYVKRMTEEFMATYPFLTQELRMSREKEKQQLA